MVHKHVNTSASACLLFQPSPHTVPTQILHEAVIIAVFMVQALKLRKNSWLVHNGQASYFNMKVLVSAEPGHMQFFKPLLTWVMIVPSVTTPTLSVTLSAIDSRIKTKICTPFTSYTFITGSRLSTQHSYTELHVTLTVQ